MGYLPALVSPFCENGNVLEFLGVKRLETKQTLSIVCLLHSFVIPDVDGHLVL